MKFHFEATGIGSVPFTNPKESCDIILRYFREAPFWPQLPKRSYLENMYVQFIEGMPGVVIDEKSRSVHIDSAKALEGIEELYSKYLEGDVDHFQISPERAAGLHTFLDVLGSGARDYAFVKGQITGPASMALVLSDETKKSIIYNTEIFEATTKLLSMKAKWQIRKLKALSDKVILFIDEPYLVSIGSSYVNIDIERTMKSIDEVANSIRSEGALAGVHCCGNTDWPMILSRDIDILSFDAYNFMTQLTLFRNEVKRFLARGGTIAWGMVPTASGETDDVDVERLLKNMRSGIGSLGDLDETVSSLVTPSCGTGTLNAEVAKKIFDLTVRLADRLKERAEKL